MKDFQTQYNILSRKIQSTTDQQLQDTLVEQQERICSEAGQQGISIDL